MADGPSALLTDGKVHDCGEPGTLQRAVALLHLHRQEAQEIAGAAERAERLELQRPLADAADGPNTWRRRIDGHGDLLAGKRRYAGYAPQITSVPTSSTHGKRTRSPGAASTAFRKTNMYGDDVQQATNYPLVRITNNCEPVTSSMPGRTEPQLHGRRVEQEGLDDVRRAVGHRNRSEHARRRRERHRSRPVSVTIQ